MNIDERIEALTARHEALTARHEALTQSVELLTTFHRDTEAAFQKLTENMDARDQKLTTKIAANADNIAQISQLVLIHNRLIQEIRSDKH